MPTLNWIGKQAVEKHHLEIPYRLLEYDDSLSAGDKESGNLLVQGDNLHALKALLPYYSGKVKCIYIDPPYNTGNENWQYNDNVNSPEIKAWLNKVVGPEGEDLSRHDKWLCMMYPRLRLLKQLLSKDGSIVISISYHEVSYLMIMCKELFPSKQIVCVTVQTSGGKPGGGFNYQHEYLIFITPFDFTPNPLFYSGGNARTPFEGLTLATFTKTQRPNQAYPIFINTSDGSLAGVGESLQERIKKGSYEGNLQDFQFNYDEASLNTVAIWPVTNKGDECVWRLIPTRLLSDWKKGYIKISPNRSKISLNKYSIQYLPIGVIKKIENKTLEVIGTEEGSPTLSFGENLTKGSEFPTIMIEKSFYTVKGTSLINDLFREKIFNYPKSLELISEILRAISSKDDIILDSFAGSGTTGHAVMELNKEDGGNRKFILVELEEKIAKEVTAERLKRVVNGYTTNKQNGNGDKVEGLGGGFRYCKLADPLFDQFGNVREGVTFKQLAYHVFFSETGVPLKENSKLNTPLIGTYKGVAYYLLFNGILGDKTVNGGNVLTSKVLEALPKHNGPKIIFGESNRLSAARLKKENIVFKQIPYEIKTS
ncbi:MAG: site-specific DNA-methyltransferase [Ignavibacteriales bacterium]|nr:site-specific DNA-methyltransferase [Ignavibacteriales bacterium]